MMVGRYGNEVIIIAPSLSSSDSKHFLKLVKHIKACTSEMKQIHVSSFEFYQFPPTWPFCVLFKITRCTYICIRKLKVFHRVFKMKDFSVLSLSQMLWYFCVPYAKILTKTLPRSKILISRIMEESGLKMGQDSSQICVWSMQDLDMVEPWYTQDPDMINLWYTQDPYKDQYARFLHG